MGKNVLFALLSATFSRPTHLLVLRGAVHVCQNVSAVTRVTVRVTVCAICNMAHTFLHAQVGHVGRRGESGHL